MSTVLLQVAPNSVISGLQLSRLLICHSFRYTIIRNYQLTYC